MYPAAEKLNNAWTKNSSTEPAQPLLSTALKPFKLILFSLGVLPCPLLRQMQRNPCTVRLWRAVHAVFMLVVICFFAIWRSVYYPNTFYRVDDEFSNIMDSIGTATLAAVHLILQVETAFKSSHSSELCQEIELIRQQLHDDLQIAVDHSALQYPCKLIFALFCFFSFMWISILFFLTIFSGTFPRLLLISLHSEFALKLKLFEFMIYMVVIFVLVQKLNTAAAEFADKLQASPDHSDVIARIFILQDLHAKLWLSVRQLQYYFEWSMPSIILKTFVDLTIMAYWLYLCLDTDFKYLNIIYCLWNMALHFLTFCVTCCICSACVKSIMDPALVPSLIYKSSMRFFKRFMYFVGLVPWNCCPSVPSRYEVCRDALRCTCHFTILLLAIFYIWFIRLHNQFELLYYKEDIFLFAVDYFHYSMLILVHVVIMAESNFKWRNSSTLFHQFEDIRCVLCSELNIVVDCARLALQCCWLKILFWLYFVLLIVVETFCVVIFKLPLLFSITYFSEIVLRVKTMEYLTFLVIVMALMERINAGAEKFVGNLQFSRFDTWPERRALLKNLAVLQDLHAKLWLCTRQIEEYFEWSLPSLVLKLFVDITLMSYWIYTSIGTEYLQLNLVYCICVTSAQMVSLVLAGCMCSAMGRNAKKFRQIFFGITADRRNPYLNACLRQMLLQLQHEPIVFSAGGFVDINRETLGKFLFTVITFMVILIQFSMEVWQPIKKNK